MSFLSICPSVRSAPGAAATASPRRRGAAPTTLARALTACALLGGAWACSAGGPGETSTNEAAGSPSAGNGNPLPGGSLPAQNTPLPGNSESTSTVLLTDEGLSLAEKCDSILEVTYRDFTEAHIDFEMDYRGDGVRRKLIEPELGANGKPVFLSSTGCPFDRNTALDCNNNTPSNQVVIANSESFSQWYQTVDGVNLEFPSTLELEETEPGSGIYRFNSTSFFPLSTLEGFGPSPAGRDKNFLFTTEIHLSFSYQRGQKFAFRGDDDLWIFVNGRLAMDLGSLHGPEDGEIDFDAQAADLGIVAGRTYAMDIFHAERHTDGSNFGFETNIACFTPSVLY